MSHYAMNYGDAWADLRKDVKKARAKYLKAMERLEPYSDSAQGQKDIEAAKADYEAELEAARAIARPKFDRAVNGMRERVAKADMTPPTAEQLATLQMLELRDRIETREIEAAAKVMGNNDAALRTLRDVLQRKGQIMPSSVKTFEAQTRDAVDTLTRAASSLLKWDGRDGQQVVSDYLAKRNAYQWGGGGEAPSHDDLASRAVADIEARSNYSATIRAIIGDDASAAVVEALD